MKKIVLPLVIAATLALFCSCSISRTVPWQKKIIPGRYHYTHSWTYPSPEGGYTITCDEEGIIEFDYFGSYTDRAIQYHTANTPDRTCWTFDYECHGRWDVVNDQFLFNELPSQFYMELMGVQLGLHQSLDWASAFANKIVSRARPKSTQMITFDIVILNKEAFTWSYTYPDGHTDYWEMLRIDR